MCRKSHILGLSAIIAAASSSPAQAETVIGVPTNWRLEGYANTHTVVLWFTGATGCANGGLHGPNMSQDDYNRLWALILTAKATGKVGRSILHHFIGHLYN